MRLIWRKKWLRGQLRTCKTTAAIFTIGVIHFSRQKHPTSIGDRPLCLRHFLISCWPWGERTPRCNGASLPRVWQEMELSISEVMDVYLEEYSADTAIARYTSRTAGYGISYLLKNDYAKVYLSGVREFLNVPAETPLRLLEFGCGGGDRKSTRLNS